jgi:protein O-mannosyl-transferase
MLSIHQGFVMAEKLFILYLRLNCLTLHSETISMKSSVKVSKKRNKTTPRAPWSGSLDYLPAGAIIVCTFILYFHSLRNGFVNWDDPDYVLNNDFIHRLSWPAVRAIFSGFQNDNYHPFTTLSLALEYAFAGGSSATLYHFDNLMLHLVNTGLVFWFISRISDNRWIPAMVAFWFGIHPMHVESVAWVSERKDVLYGCFFLASLISYSYYIKNSRINEDKPLTERTRGRQFYLLTFSLFLFALFSKSAAVVLPLVLLLIDFLLRRKFSARLLIEKIPFLALSLLFGILAIISQRGAMNREIEQVLTPFNRFLIVSYGFLKYIVMSFFPAGMSAFHPYPLSPAGKPGLLVYLSVPVNLLVIILVILSMRKSRKYFFGLAFFLITIILVLRILPVGSAVISERYTYIPYIGIFYITGIFLTAQWHNKNAGTLLRTLPVALFAGFSIFFTVKTYSRIGVWRDDLSLWGDVIRVYPDNYWGYYMRGTSKGRNNDLEGGLRDLEKSIFLQPNNPYSYNNRGKIFYLQKKYSEALESYNAAIRLDPGLLEAYNNRGAVRGTCGDLRGACSDFSKAIDLGPGFPDAYRNRGLAEMLLHQADSAKADWNKAISMGDREAQKLLEHYFP